MIDTKSFDKYLKDISDKASLKNYTEYTFRSDIENLLRDIYKGIKITEITQEGRTEDGNKPDFIISENKVPILYIETKALGESLDKIELSEQMSRYFYGYTNLVLTDYLEFRFYRNGQRYTEPIRIAKLEDNNTIIPISENFELLEKTFQQFPQDYREPIRSGSHLAKIMAGKAQRIRDNVKTFINNPDERNNSIRKIYDAFKRTLVHDLTIESFADMYAQTIVYGLFVARYYDETEDDFSRAEAMNLIPASNPFLRQFFAHIAGVEFDYRLEFIVDELCKVFSHSDVKNLLSEYFKQKTGQDPIIHFYEDFLSEYDPELKRKMGAYYTPKPVVDFIVQSVDEVLKKHFKIERGLVDSSKYESGEHMIQILDPATGTGTFFTAVLEYIKNSIKNSSQPGKWGPTYIHHDLLPRVHAFELMMTPYTISHLRASIFFERSGFTHFNNRLGIYLTNALESAPEQTTLYSDTLGFAGSIAEESKVAEIVKQDKPVMVVLGNPPYSVSSSNKGEWITDLIKVYKENLNERKINLDDDYIKFIRYSENFIEKNSKGIVAMITNNSFIDGITHRQMRKHLLETFDDIYILDLHGNSKKKEVSPDGSKDENIFDIMQGVSINIFVRRKKEKKDLGKVHHFDLYGTRQKKFEFLEKNSIGKIKWNVLDYKEPYYFFVPKDFRLEEDYYRGFDLSKLFLNFTVGVGTKVDKIAIDFNKPILMKRVKDILDSQYSREDLISLYSLNNNTTWEYERAISATFDIEKFVKYDYRPFDTRYVFYDNDFLSRSRERVMKEFLKKDNIGLEVGRTIFVAFVSKHISDEHFGGAKSYKLPLFIYENNTKQSNLNPEIVKQLEEITGKTTPENIFDYIYGVLYDPKYREKYKEFLKIDFPKIPYPKNKEIFKKYIKTGKELRELHLLESPKIEKFITSWPISGNNIVEDVKYKEGKVYINQTQYFGNVPEKVWNYYIGGYQPAQKWLKDRKGRELTNDEVDHYQKMVKSIMETINITERNY